MLNTADKRASLQQNARACATTNAADPALLGWLQAAHESSEDYVGSSLAGRLKPSWQLPALRPVGIQNGDELLGIHTLRTHQPETTVPRSRRSALRSSATCASALAEAQSAVCLSTDWKLQGFRPRVSTESSTARSTSQNPAVIPFVSRCFCFPKIDLSS